MFIAILNKKNPFNTSPHKKKEEAKGSVDFDKVHLDEVDFSDKSIRTKDFIGLIGNGKYIDRVLITIQSELERRQ